MHMRVLREWCLESWFVFAVFDLGFVIGVWATTHSVLRTILAWLIIPCLPLLAMFILDTAEQFVRKVFPGISRS